MCCPVQVASEVVSIPDCLFLPLEAYLTFSGNLLFGA
nr:MAG TPA: hypothetical protein [Caudoviricetes sp.]